MKDMITCLGGIIMVFAVAGYVAAKFGMVPHSATDSTVHISWTFTFVGMLVWAGGLLMERTRRA